MAIWLPDHPFNQALTGKKPVQLGLVLNLVILSNLSFNETRTKAFIRLRMVRDEHLQGIEYSLYPNRRFRQQLDVTIQVNGKDLEGFKPM